MDSTFLKDFEMMNLVFDDRKTHRKNRKKGSRVSESDLKLLQYRIRKAGSPRRGDCEREDL
jgi:hypothetical protein